MRIADVAEFYAEQGGGVRTYIHSKLAAAARLGHDVTVIAPRPEGGVEEREGGRIVWIPSPPMPGDPRYAVLLHKRAVHAALDRYAPDLVEGSSVWTGGWFAALWEAPVPKVLVFHQDPVAVFPQTFLGGLLGRERVDRLCEPFWSYLRRLSRHFDQTLVSGSWLAKRLQGFGVQAPCAVPFGVDKDRFSQAAADPRLRARLAQDCGVAVEDPLFVTVSRFHPEKRFNTLMSAFERYARDRRAGWIIYGGGPMEAWIRHRAKHIPGMHVAGYTRDREELAAVMATADAMLHGSAAETFGLVVAEALCAGLPVIVPDAGGAHDLAHPGCSEVYEAGDAAAMVEAMHRLVARPRAERVASCQAARERIWTMDGHFDALFSHYEELAGLSEAPRSRRRRRRSQ